MKAGRVLFFFFLLGCSLQAQVRHAVSLKREGMGAPVARALSPSSSSSDTIRILALMVNFPQDTDTLTTGNGRFQMDAASAARLIDPPPHDSAYFAYKLMFLSNYFRKVSNGKVNIKGEVFGKTITLSKKMSAYSPPKDKSNNKPLADLVVESWHTADSLYPALQFSQYNAFILFHAGAGRDIDLVEILGFDPTPNDIPSITFNLKTFQEYLKDPSYAGIPVSKGAFRITNTMVLPETESRVLVVGGVLDTIRLSFNGLLANSFGSYLGLPDLFNTKTGASGIGRFGLMDRGGISAFNGLFPPEPSAWEKVYLGWVTPITVSSGTTTLSLPAVSLTNVGQDTIYKVPINEREYFLIENRSRDPQQNGQRLTIRQGNSIITKYFPVDTVGFLHSAFADVSAITGSVIDVEDFDWALPGLLAESEEFKGGGILIWHIDEDVIARGLQDNTVNANQNLRGVDLEEADGSQDVGRTYTFQEAGSGTEFGWPLDCWFDGNTTIVYKNLFDKNSSPNSKSNSGAQSLITIKNFSKRLPRMTATVQIGDDQFQRLDNFSRSLSVNNSTLPPTIFPTASIVPAGRKVYAFQQKGTSKTNDPTGLFASAGGQFPIAGFETINNGHMLAGAQDSSLYFWTAYDRNNDGVYDSLQTVITPLGARVTTPPAFADLSIARSVIIGGESGTIWQVNLNGAVSKKTSVSTSPVSSIAQLPTVALSKPNEYFFACGGKIYSELASVSLGDSSFPWILAGGTSSLGNFIVAAQRGGRRVVVYNRNLTDKVFDNTIADGSISSVSVADVDGDGKKDIVLLAGKNLYAMNQAGSFLAGFPLRASGDGSFVGFPLIGDVNGDSFPDIIALQSTGEVTACDRNGQIISGFPIQLSGAGEAFPSLFQTSNGKIGALRVTASGSLQAVELNRSYKAETMMWSQYLGDALHQNRDGSVIAITNPTPSEFLPKARTYNWPNPVYGSTTHIRYYTPEDADISIKIFDLAGTKITELKARSLAGIDGEVAWNVSNVQSGVYLARIEATDGSRNEVAIIKIAVVK
ncbi:MAG: T9SS type A sorting domain-containing protein [Ignavibacteriales bacterium]|nr:T9SS type A sorting domain-containing protein [Ignavibacteriales bacterium]